MMEEAMLWRNRRIKQKWDQRAGERAKSCCLRAAEVAGCVSVKQ